MPVVVSQTPAKIAGQLLTESIVRHDGKPILLMFSGGSALSILDYIDTTVLNPNLTITTLDERYSKDEAVNNFAQIKATDFYKNALRQGVKEIATTVVDESSLQKFGEKFEKALRSWKEENPNGVILATVGIGIDGHVAGIFSGKQTVNFSGDAWVVDYEVAKEINPFTKRVTVTYTFLRNQLNEAIVYATGPEKKPIIKQLEQASNCFIDKTPACIIRELSSVTIVTD